MTDFQDTMIASYDALFTSEGFSFDGQDNDGYGNLGYFGPGVGTHAEACVALMDRLMARIGHRQGRVLDVACGLGGTTRLLTRRFPAEAVDGINISDKQLDACRARVPGARFHRMAAERLEFPDASFDVVISVEAAMHFQGRRDFLTEARRVLKPGGEIVVADMPFHAEPTSFRAVLSRQEIYRDVDDYLDLWQGCGFADVRADDVTGPVWRGFVRHVSRQAMDDHLNGRIGPAEMHSRLKLAHKVGRLPALAYLFLHATKPAS